MSILFLLALAALLVGAALLIFIRYPKDRENARRSDLEGIQVLRTGGWVVAGVGALLMVLASFAIIETGKAGVVRVVGVVQQEALGEGLNPVAPWATVTRQETRGFQIDQSGENAMEVLTGNGTRFTIELGIPVKLNPASVAMVESRIEGGNWQTEVTALSRGLTRTNVAGYQTFGEFNTRRATPLDGVEYGEELASQIETRVNGLFCDTYGICGIDVVDVGVVNIRKVNPPAAITSEAAALEAAQLAQQTEVALNEVEKIRALRRTEEGNGYGNLFAFLPDGAMLTAGDAANFLRAAAVKTQADADAYMQRQLAESIADAMSKNQPLPSIIISTGGVEPVPMFNTGQ